MLIVPSHFGNLARLAIKHLQVQTQLLGSVEAFSVLNMHDLDSMVASHLVSDCSYCTFDVDLMIQIDRLSTDSFLGNLPKILECLSFSSVQFQSACKFQHMFHTADVTKAMYFVMSLQIKVFVSI
jgi:hypothetical protein